MLCVTDELGAGINITDELGAEFNMLHVTDELGAGIDMLRITDKLGAEIDMLCVTDEGNTGLEPPGHIFHITMQPLLEVASETSSITSTPLLHLQNSSGVMHISVRNFSR